MTYVGDQAFTRESLLGTVHELEYAGATSLFRRRYTKDHTQADFAVVGVPSDIATTNRPGARFGPRAVRAASASMSHGRVWPWRFNPFNSLAVVDTGDVMFDEGDLSSMLGETQSTVAALGATRPIAIGGDHLISLPVLRAVVARSGPVALLHFDAHSDTWHDDRLNHGSVFYHALKEGLILPNSSVQFGIRSFNADDDGLLGITTPTINHSTPQDLAALITDRVGGSPVYISLDIDVLDPAFAPGTGTPEPGGLSTAVVRDTIFALGCRPPLDIVGIDLVEVAPAYDPAEITAIAGAQLLLDLVCLAARAADETLPIPQPSTP